MDSERILEPVAILSRRNNDIVNQIVNAETPAELDDLVNKFKMNQIKRNIIRAHGIDNTLTMIDDEVALRVSTTPEQIADKDLINYMNSTQKALQDTLNNYSMAPTIQINNNTLEVNNNGLTIESRKRIDSAVASILKQLQENNESLDVIDVEEND